MLSYQAIVVSHSGQNDRGETTESSRGSRKMNTLKKLPINSPARNARISSKIICSSFGWTHESSLGVLHEIVQRRHVGNRQSLHAVQEPQLKNIRPEKRPGRLKY